MRRPSLETAMVDVSPEYSRRSIRLEGYDYSQEGMYFVTICVFNHVCSFGHIDNDVVVLNVFGKTAFDAWKSIPEHFPGVELDEFVVMPNHVHGILCFTEDERRATHASPLLPGIQAGKPKGPGKRSLGAVIGSYKSAVTCCINKKQLLSGTVVWQRNYFEHIIRDGKSYDKISEYIATNPERWDSDIENPDRKGTDEFHKWLTSFSSIKGGCSGPPLPKEPE